MRERERKMKKEREREKVMRKIEQMAKNRRASEGEQMSKSCRASGKES